MESADNTGFQALLCGCPVLLCSICTLDKTFKWSYYERVNDYPTEIKELGKLYIYPVFDARDNALTSLREVIYG